MRTNIFRRAVVAGATVAVATAGLAAVTSTSASAAPADLKFNCSASILTGQEFGLTADITLPAKVEAGKTVKASFTGTVSAPDTTRATAYAILGARFIEGTANITGKFGATPISMGATVPKAAIPAESGPMALPASGSGSWVAKNVGSQNVTIDGFTAPLVITNAEGVTTPIQVTCEAKAPETVVGTVEVTKATVVATKTTAKAKYAKKTKKATVNVKVVNDKKKAVKGKVKLTLKKGKKVVGKKTVTLNKKGVAKGVFKVKAKGKYTVVAQYQGTKTTKKSKATAKFTVKK
ncbi:DUF6801 domain-containing protein [Nocardioides jishulii]|uniref:DUF6801 domain-containing protein n=1 Tax=Nocardioides jishulii TaxID=2575440 RepID=A0A4V5TL60_9ACTN|nr:DUF6801 domain-containing protein [Nocardioides jishulii]QCX28019.1 hypothetical protein FCL41_11200 [Nocardioides jishulii]TKI60683.1 hypothetical protein FC770_14275 [Nocardioides jishulii]